MIEVRPAEFPWDRLSEEDCEACRRDLLLCGQVYATTNADGKVVRVPPEEIVRP